MNPDLALTRPYPFTRLKKLLEGSQPPAGKKHISLSIGEPKHPAPSSVLNELYHNFQLFEKYPSTNGMPELREAIANWNLRRHGVKLNPATQILPVNGSREALFSFTQAAIDSSKNPTVLMPCPFYQIYEGAAIMAGAKPVYIPTTAENDFVMDLEASASEEELENAQLVFVCSPSNPTGKVLGLAHWKKLFELADKYNFIIASDECYSEIYFDEDNPPLGALQAAKILGRDDFDKLVVFSSLSKRSNIPGMRTGFVSGDAKLLKPYLLYRTYHGCAMSGPLQKASIIAWNDEEHVKENRRLYHEKFEAGLPLVQQTLEVEMPDASFYLWAKTPIDDKVFTRRLYEEAGITVLPGSFLGRELANGINPGSGYVRIALVATTEEVKEATQRIAEFKI
ncbi:MAG: succinyldiaminopimelate transaminase [Turicimonas muris]|uniref:succinyldiaminopimelate transaminase n=1 Tax=Turicimonas muris TaxID=1796652 RepID=UPI0025B6B3E5|nr:succinyldiaminopimelate transaminase [Turicimonas muris]